MKSSSKALGVKKCFRTLYKVFDDFKKTHSNVNEGYARSLAKSFILTLIQFQSVFANWDILKWFGKWKLQQKL